MQRGLFDQQNIARMRYNDLMMGLNIREARLQLPLFDLPDTAQAKDLAMQDLERDISSMTQLSAAAWVDFLLLRLPTVYQNGPLKEDIQLINAPLKEEIVRRICPNDLDYYSSGLHPADLLTQTERYVQSRELIQRTLAKTGEDAWLRQLLSINSQRTGDHNNSIRHLSMSLFFDPYAFRPDRFIHEPVIDTWAELQAELTEEDARPALPFILWQKRFIPIDTADKTFMDAIDKAVSLAEPLTDNPTRQGVYFLHLMVRAERLKSRNASIEALAEHRARMKTVNPELFSRYMTTLQ